MDLIMWPGDTFKECHRETYFDIQQFIKMREAGLRTVLQWEEIKHFHITEAYRTIWSLSEASFEAMYKEGKPIGQEQPTTDFIREILKGITDVKVSRQGDYKKTA